MKTILIILAAALLFGCAQNAQPNQSTTPTGGVTVIIQNFSFSPSTITIARGTTVTWEQMDPASHTVTFGDFDSGSLAQGKNYSHTFNDAGTFTYHCGFHPSMQGTVIVK